MSRTVTCGGCDRDYVTPSDTGRPPTRCPTCRPDSRGKYRQEVLELRTRVDELEHELAEAIATGRPRRRATAAPCRQSLLVAIRRVGTAEGARETAERLSELAAEAQAWAELISDSCRADGRAP